MQSLFLIIVVRWCLLTVVSSQNSGNFTSVAAIVLHIRFAANSRTTIHTSSTSFTWINQSSDHFGIASLNGQNQWINIGQFADNNNQTLPSVIGSSMSFEFWTRLNAFNLFSRLIEIGAAFDLYNIFIANVGTSRSLNVRVGTVGSASPTGS